MPAARITATLTAMIITVAATWTLHAVPPSPLAQQLGPTPVVVELFTSQGCSSCPPADALISEVANDPSLRGKVIPLAFHVDYWNRLGWRDPFSSPEWSRRQMFYVRSLNAASAYTPQVVVNGRRQFVGSNRGALETTMMEASHRVGAAKVSLSVERRGDSMSVTVHAGAIIGAGEHDLYVVVFENAVPTNIERGENSGRSTVEDAIVRRLVRVATVTSAPVDKTVSIPLEASWKSVGAVALLQDHATLTIDGAALAR